LPIVIKTLVCESLIQFRIIHVNFVIHEHIILLFPGPPSVYETECHNDRLTGFPFSSGYIMSVKYPEECGFLIQVLV